jgi:hypothetical protein
MPLNSAISVQNMGITTHFLRFECSVTSTDFALAYVAFRFLEVSP